MWPQTREAKILVQIKMYARYRLPVPLAVRLPARRLVHLQSYKRSWWSGVLRIESPWRLWLAHGATPRHEETAVSSVCTVVLIVCAVSCCASFFTLSYAAQKNMIIRTFNTSCIIVGIEENIDGRGGHLVASDSSLRAAISSVHNCWWCEHYTLLLV